MSNWERTLPYLTVVTLLVVGLLLIGMGDVLDSAWLLWFGFFLALPVTALAILFFLLYAWFKERRANKSRI